MILVTVGTNEQPFDRLVRAAAGLAGSEPLLVQYGSSRVAHGRGTWVDFVGFDELAEHMRAARTVVCHAGVGSIMLAHRCGKRPIVVPRRLHLREAVDDHQLMLAQRLDVSRLVKLVDDERDLPAALAAYASEPDGETGGDPAGVALAGVDALADDVRLYLEGLVA
jgi:UDP-N-acetylglucosamine transferase subunit ALG13